MKYDVVLLDLDGTLTESAPGITHSARIAVEQMGYTGFDDKVFEGFIGPPLHHTFQALFAMDDAQAEEAVRRYRVYFSEYGLFENAVYTGIPSLLRRLKAGGARLFVATAKPQVFAERILERFGLSRFFEGVVGTRLEERAMDKNAIVRDALPKDAGRAVMIGDRCQDMTAGQANGIDTIGVCYGYGTRRELEEAGATYVAETVAELSEFLAGEVPVPQGLFVTVEGLDGSGKSTQISRLLAHLRQLGYDVVHTREPGGSPIAEKIRHLVLSPENLGMHAWTEALLYAAARAEHVHAVVRPALEAGHVVLCDRCVDSSIVYQGAGRNLGIDRVLAVNAPGIDGIMPGVTIYLRVDPQTAMQRRSSATALDRIEMERESFHQRVFEAYEALAQRDAHRIRVVDASRPVEDIAAAACAQLDQALAAL